MRNTIYIVIILILSCGCEENYTKKNKIEIQEKKEISYNKKSEPTENKKTVLVEQNFNESIFEKVYIKHTEINSLKEYDGIQSTVIDLGKTEFEYGIEEIRKGDSIVLLFERLINDGKPIPKSKILDTILINNLKENEFISLGLCQKNKVYDGQILAIIERTKNDSDLEYHSNVIKAWKADVESKKFEMITELKEIECVNESFGL